MIPERYQSKPTQPVQAEVFLLSEDNLQEVADWWNRLAGATRYMPETAHVDVSENGNRRLLVPYRTVGWVAHESGNYLVHLGNGDTQPATPDTLHEWYEPCEPGDPSLCSCLTPAAHGTSEDDEPMRWDSDCKVCGKTLPEQYRAQLASETPHA